jgi:hypothetical protein
MPKRSENNSNKGAITEHKEAIKQKLTNFSNLSAFKANCKIIMLP